jgi:hypothetical protein
MFNPYWIIRCTVFASALNSFLNMDQYFGYDYITCNIMLGNKTLGIIYFLVHLYWQTCPRHHLCRWMAILRLLFGEIS